MSGPVAGRPESDRDADPELVALLESPYETVAGTHRRLGELLAAFEARGDRRAAFLSVYVRTTGAVAARLERGGFTASDWMADYLVAFANRYREAVLAHETGDTEALAPAWRLAFRAADRGEASAVRLAALGVNAHVNHDLALALADVGLGTGDVRATRRADHRAVTEVIADLTGEVRAVLLARTDGAAQAPADERVAGAIAGCRERAWQTAVGLGSRLGVRQRAARWVNDTTARLGARLLLRAPLGGLLAGSEGPAEEARQDDRQDRPASRDTRAAGGVASRSQPTARSTEPTPSAGVCTD